MSTKLLEIKKSNPTIYGLIKNEVDKIIDYGIEIKYIKEHKR
jgi:hypothetical protein